MINEITQMILIGLGAISVYWLYTHMKETRLPVKFEVFQLILIALLGGLAILSGADIEKILSMPLAGKIGMLIMPILWVIFNIWAIKSTTVEMRQEEALAKAFPGQIESIRKSLTELSTEDKAHLDAYAGNITAHGRTERRIASFMHIAKKNGVTDFMEQYAIAFAAVHGFTGENKETEASEVTVNKDA